MVEKLREFLRQLDYRWIESRVYDPLVMDYVNVDNDWFKINKFALLPCVDEGEIDDEQNDECVLNYDMHYENDAGEKIEPLLLYITNSKFQFLEVDSFNKGELLVTVDYSKEWKNFLNCCNDVYELLMPEKI